MDSKNDSSIVEEKTELIPNNSYTVQRIHFRRKDLLYPDVQELLKLISTLADEFNAAFSVESSDFFGFAQTLFEKNLIPRLFSIILEPDNSNPLLALWNKFWMWKYSIDSGNVINSMTTDQWRSVLADFFISSGQWIESWLRSVPGFGLESSQKSSNSSGLNLMTMILNRSTMKSPAKSSSTQSAQEDSASINN